MTSCENVRWRGSLPPINHQEQDDAVNMVITAANNGWSVLQINELDENRYFVIFSGGYTITFDVIDEKLDGYRYQDMVFISGFSHTNSTATFNLGCYRNCIDIVQREYKLPYGYSAGSVIYYTSTNGRYVELAAQSSLQWGANIVSNVYDNGVGLLAFDKIITKIPAEAFYNCKTLASFTIPDSVTSIGDYAFYGCSSLVEVYCKSTTPPSAGDYMFTGNASGRKIYVPKESVDAYKNAEYWGIYADSIVGYNF